MSSQKERISHAIGKIVKNLNQSKKHYLEKAKKSYEEYFQTNNFYMYLKGGRVETGFANLIKQIVDSEDATKAKAFIYATEELLPKHFDVARAFRYREKFEEVEGLFACPVYKDLEKIVRQRGSLQDIVDIAMCAGTDVGSLMEEFIYRSIVDGVSEEYISNAVDNVINVRREKELNFVKTLYVGDAEKINQKINKFLSYITPKEINVKEEDNSSAF